MNKAFRPILCMLLFASECATAQVPSSQHVWILFRDKGIQNLRSPNPAALGISERALKRRAKTLLPDRLIDELDYPVSSSAIVQIEQSGVKVRTISRWFNAVSVDATPAQMKTLQSLPITLSAEPVVVLKRSMPLPVSVFPPLNKLTSTSGIDYGFSSTQLTNIKVVNLHAVGVNGTGVLIGMIDDGFNNFRTHVALKNINVVADSDFIHNINDVSRQPWESSSQGNHGAGTLSEVGGFDNGHMIGAAYGASFILAKTEMDSSGSYTDFHSEEDTYVAALEWAERLGADITSSSLGYKDFSPPPTYSTSDMNGRTTKVARAAVIAARKGVLVVTAMGNEGYMPGPTGGLAKDTTLISPADADSIISVGNTTSDGELNASSSTGPTADGRIKPEVVAQGTGIYWASGSTTNGYQGGVSGTSCSTPLVAGAAALILSAHPELTNMQVRQALLATATPSNFITIQYPNNYYGYGFVDAFNAALYHGPIFSNTPQLALIDTQVNVSIFIVSKSGILNDSVYIYYSIDGRPFSRNHLQPTSTPNEFSCFIPNYSQSSSVVVYFSMHDTSGQRHVFPPTDTVQHYITIKATLPQKYTLSQNYPNPFNGITTFIFKSPVSEEIEVKVFNILGQQVKTIFHGHSIAGINMFRWDGMNNQGNHVATGVYFARIKTPSAVISKKMLYLK